MSSKYIIELGKDANMVQVISVTQSGNAYIDSTVYVEYLEQLTADYINEHFPTIQQDAYDRGYKDGRNVTETQAHDDAYKRGLEDGRAQEQNRVWEYAKKIVLQPEDGGISKTELDKIFGFCSIQRIFGNYTAQQAIEKLEAYEEKQKADDKIEVGDEVEWDNDFTGDRFIVTRIYQPYGKKEQCDGIDDDGDVYRAVLIESLVKTGRHFDIASILEEMRK